MALATLGVLSSAGSVLVGGLVIRSSYIEWVDSHYNEEATIAEKLWIAFRGFLGLAQVGTGLVSLGSHFYEWEHTVHENSLQELKKQCDDFPEECRKEIQELYRQNRDTMPSFVLVPAFCYLKMSDALDKHLNLAGLCMSKRLAAVENFRNLNMILCGLHSIQLGGNILLAARKPDPKIGLKFQITTKVLQGGGAIYISLARASCSNDLVVDMAAQVAESVIDVAEKYLIIQQKIKEIREEHRPMTLDGIVYLPYRLPESLNDRAFQYDPIPPEYGDMEEFQKEICPITWEPIARALFIFQDNFPYIFDKKSIAKYIFGRREEGMSSLNPKTNLEFRSNDIYESPQWNYERDAVVKKLQAQELAILRQRVGAQ